ncbi:MAG: STAS domain-containing protein, partial [Spirochaetota bacterium]|nr:STAS domain-containing protein [Spirochaetota bacterium]
MSNNSNNNLVPGFNDEKDDSLKINLEKVTGIENSILIYLSGYIDTYNSLFFQKRIAKIIEAGYVNIIFNCASLNYVSSTGIGSFTAFLKMLKPKGGDIVLLEIQPKVYEVFQLLGFSQFFNIKDSIDDAIHFFKQETV